MRFTRGLALVVAVGVCGSAAYAEEVKAGLDKKIGGAFNVKAFTGDNKGKSLCYV